MSCWYHTAVHNGCFLLVTITPASLLPLPPYYCCHCRQEVLRLEGELSAAQADHAAMQSALLSSKQTVLKLERQQATSEAHHRQLQVSRLRMRPHEQHAVAS